MRLQNVIVGGESEFVDFRIMTNKMSVGWG